MVLFLNGNMNGVLRSTPISEGVNGFSSGALAPLDDGDRFGIALAALPDMDDDGVQELVVSSTIICAALGSLISDPGNRSFGRRGVLLTLPRGKRGLRATMIGGCGPSVGCPDQPIIVERRPR